MRHIQKLFVLAGVLFSAALTTSVEAAKAKAQSAELTKPENQITVLYDAFWRDSSMKKDWGFAALIKANGKRVLFDTRNNSEIFAHNVKAKGVNLTKLDFVVISHRHGDHIGGLNHLLSVNPNVKIYAPRENFGLFGASLPGTKQPERRTAMNTSVPAGHRLIGKWYNGLGNGQYIRYQFTDVGAYAYSSPLRSISGTFAVENDQLTLSASDGTIESYTFRFECIGTGSFSEYLTLSNNATHLETPYVRDPTDPRQFCK